jgi:hypothetical protein
MYSRAAGLPAAERPGDGFGTSPAFTDGPHIAAVADEYAHRVVGQLLWPGRPHSSLLDCMELVQRYADIV